MQCKMCRSVIGSGDLCARCADKFIYDSRISGYRLNKHQLIHTNVRESRLRKILNKMYGVQNIIEEASFDWCKSPKTSALLRFDFAILQNDSFFLIEFNGEQHYKKIKFFHKTKEQYNDQRIRDKEKVTACKQNKILLISIPFHVALNDGDVKLYIERHSKESK